MSAAEIMGVSAFFSCVVLTWLFSRLCYKVIMLQCDLSKVQLDFMLHDAKEAADETT